MPIFDEIHLKFLQIIIPFAVISLSVLVSIISYFVNQKIVRSRYRKALYEEIYFNYGLINNFIPELPVKDEQILVPISRSFMAASWLFSFDIYDALKAKSPSEKF